MPATPRAVVVERFGPPESFALGPAPSRAPGAGEVAVRVAAAGLSHVDLLIASGEYQVRPPLPFIPGTEFAGIVEAVGEGVDHVRAGERVCGSGWGGALTQRAIAPAERVLAIPATMPFDQAAVFRVSFTTAWHALVQRGALRPGETVLVLGAGGAVGHAAVQVARALGARVIASASSPAKRTLALAGGAEAAIEARSETWREDVRAACAGRPLDLVVDPLGDTATEPAFRSLGWGGRHLVIGFAGGAIPRLATNLALLKGAALVGVDIKQFEERFPEAAAQNLAALLALHAQGAIVPAVGRRYALADFRAAMEDVRAGETVGRVVVEME
ncbi:NADPH:quinone oxidoreductase family protein [Novosphingobium resinovorum]|uniref:Zinc-binding alcohol dehydrogenase n=1 Tax=Novosphingobium resinovorum TaxID=158500 RepID=A0A1D8AEF0_9SPHN|nr:NADPH:quinone oxidoreductase family protein [Novosphingobium resinovorum]AOR80499.1 zinc-binding alcohol dehydrogenase [Novosphingobium resinovorum]